MVVVKPSEAVNVIIYCTLYVMLINRSTSICGNVSVEDKKTNEKKKKKIVKKKKITKNK